LSKFGENLAGLHADAEYNPNAAGETNKGPTTKCMANAGAYEAGIRQFSF
jgi:hypothetical protein